MTLSDHAMQAIASATGNNAEDAGRQADAALESKNSPVRTVTEDRKVCQSCRSASSALDVALKFGNQHLQYPLSKLLRLTTISQLLLFFRTTLPDVSKLYIQFLLLMRASEIFNIYFILFYLFHLI
jgi:hypothetical protein